MHANGQLNPHAFMMPAVAPPPPIGDFQADLACALSRRPMHISPKYLYDKRGSELFDKICELPEYYPTRTEIELLNQHSEEISALAGLDAEVIEFGAGALRKTRFLLQALHRPARYLPIDISGEFLSECADTLHSQFPELAIEPVIGDYTQALDLPAPDALAQRRIGFFPGSTLGNLEYDEALAFLVRARGHLHGGGLLLGADLIKDPAILHAAYNDEQGVTAAFNRNLLYRANDELDTNFEPAAFVHSAFYNAPQRRIEMHLISLRAQSVRLGDEVYRIDEGETLHTENSYKFTVSRLQAMANEAGFRPGPSWVDANGLFSLNWFHA